MTSAKIFAAKVKINKEDNSSAQEEVVATAAATSTTNSGVTAFGPPLTKQVDGKRSGLENEDKEIESAGDDGLNCSSHSDNASSVKETLKNTSQDLRLKRMVQILSMIHLLSRITSCGW